VQVPRLSFIGPDDSKGVNSAGSDAACGDFLVVDRAANCRNELRAVRNQIVVPRMAVVAQVRGTVEPDVRRRRAQVDLVRFTYGRRPLGPEIGTLDVVRTAKPREINHDVVVHVPASLAVIQDRCDWRASRTPISHREHH
jgi:hypothetical protein